MLRRGSSLLVLAIVIGLMLTGSTAGQTVRVAHKWGSGSAFDQGLVSAAIGFESKYPGVKVEVQNSMTVDKTKVAIAAGDPPEAYVLWPAVSWGADGLVQPLDRYIAQSGLSPQGFVPAAWVQNVWDGKTWGLPLQIDPNFAMVWHKDKFAAAGLHAGQGPTTVKMLDNYIRRLTLSTSDGKPLQLGMIPWLGCGSCGHANEIFTWGWIFGGDFFNVETGRVTAHDSRNVEALEYLKEYWERYNDMYVGLGGSLPAGRNRFTAGREVIRFMVSGELFTALSTFPDLDLGIGKMPVNSETGEENPAWIGGFSLGLITGARNPDTGWQLISYLSGDPEGATLFSEASGYMPALIKAPGFRKLGADPQWRVWTEIAMTTQRYRPAIPVLDFYTAQLNTLYPKALDGRVTPRAGLEEVSRLVELEMTNKYGR